MAASSRSRTGTKPSSGKLAARGAPSVLPASVTDAVANQARASSPNSLLVEQQIRTLADLCDALDRKSMELLSELSTCREAVIASDTALAVALQEFADYRGTAEQKLSVLSELRDQELAEAARIRTTLERDLAFVREAGERTDRAIASARDHRQDWRRPEGQAQASRLMPLLDAVLAAGEIRTLHDTLGALAQYGAAGMVDSVEGTHDAPFCNGWLLSRSDVESDPLVFLMDDNGLLGWTEGNRERLDVNIAFKNTKPRPGFKALLSRAPVGRIRAIVAISEQDETVVFFESANRVVPPDLFLGVS
jgi:hypothetical protein